ncbi:hypothetical protein IGI04_035234 [Brassica rapa subsp. trilocularis]|uniref:F-box associated domain-containing protein n=1 Tax=Brassica rapa subsp. trilocularis TaxID=1813537 RepID=A0ABQ7LB03_BRACM|nr:hypothetical protein IGI04_035234 [Brassica rapa subsp. trilocularis]
MSIMGRGGRKESYRIYRSALKVRFPSAPYSTFVVPNSPLYYAAGQGRHELYLLVESGVDIINLWNYRGKRFWKQTALMQACQHGHWEGAFVAHVTVEDGTTIDLIDPETKAWLEQHKHFV